MKACILLALIATVFAQSVSYPTLLNGFQNYQNHSRVSYFTENNILYMDGYAYIANGTESIGKVVFLIPSEYVPNSRTRFQVAAEGSSVWVSVLYRSTGCTSDTSKTCIIIAWDQTWVGGWISFSGVSYLRRSAYKTDPNAPTPTPAPRATTASPTSAYRTTTASPTTRASVQTTTTAPSLTTTSRPFYTTTTSPTLGGSPATTTAPSYTTAVPTTTASPTQAPTTTASPALSSTDRPTTDAPTQAPTATPVIPILLEGELPTRNANPNASSGATTLSIGFGALICIILFF